MSFRKNNDRNRLWDRFCQANRKLIEDIGLPWTTVETWDVFAYLLMHGIVDHHVDPTHFDIDELSQEKRELFRLLLDNYFAAGFADPGMHSAIVGDPEEYRELVAKYPKSFARVR
jgi:hypothetical protein